MENPFAEILKNLSPPKTRKLLFEDQCAFYAGLKLGLPQLAVSEASGLGRIAISQLARAGERLSGQRRYPAVAREYETLGHEAFVHKYLTAPMRERLMVALDAYDRRKRNPDVNAKGYNPLANRMCGRHEWKETSLGMHVVFRIDLYPDGAGYFWRNLKPFQGLPEVTDEEIPYNPACCLHGDPSRGPESGPDAKGFASSKACLHYVKREFDPPEALNTGRDDAPEPTATRKNSRAARIGAEVEAWRQAARDDDAADRAERRARVDAEMAKMQAEWAEHDREKSQK